MPALPAVDAPPPPSTQGGAGAADTLPPRCEADGGDESAVCPYCLEPFGATRMRAPCRCAGSLEYVHEECLRHDLAANHRTACSVCHEPYEILHVITERTLAQRMRAGFAEQPLYLATVTFTSVCLAAVFFFMFACFVRGALPLARFPVRDPLGAEYATLGLGLGSMLVGALVCRGALMSQPAAEHRRTLLSAPDRKGARAPLLQLHDEEGPPPPGWRPAQEAARRAAAREARIAAAHAAFAAHGGRRPSADIPRSGVQAVADFFLPQRPRFVHGDQAV